MRLVIFLASAAVSTSPCIGSAQQATPPAAACQTFTASVENALKLIAQQIDGIGRDNSVPRGQLAATRAASLQTEIQTNVTLMAQNHCPPPAFPVDEDAYRSAAVACAVAATRHFEQMENADLKAKYEAACERSNWKRG